MSGKSEETIVNLKCVGRGCSIKSDCLRYKQFSDDILHDGLKYVPVTVSACTERTNDMFIPIPIK